MVLIYIYRIHLTSVRIWYNLQIIITSFNANVWEGRDLLISFFFSLEKKWQ